MLDEFIFQFGVLGLFYRFYSILMLANNVDPGQTPHYVASGLGLHCLPTKFLRASR